MLWVRPPYCTSSNSVKSSRQSQLLDLMSRQLNIRTSASVSGMLGITTSNDRDRVVEARDELQRMLNEDLPNAMNAAEITDKLGLHSLCQHHWYIQSTCATSGEGLYEGLDWLSNNIAGKA